MAILFSGNQLHSGSSSFPLDPSIHPEKERREKKIPKALLKMINMKNIGAPKLKRLARRRQELPEETNKYIMY